LEIPTYIVIMKNLLRKHIQTTINLFLIILVLIFGSWGYYILSLSNDENYKNAEMLTVMYDTLRIFILEFNLPPTSFIPWQLQIGRFSGILLVGFAVVQTIWHFFKEYFLLSFFYQNHVIICGLGRRGFEIAKDFLGKQDLNGKYKVVAIEKESGNEYIQKIKELGCIVLKDDASDKDQLIKAKIYKAKYLITVTDNDRTNLEIAINTHDLLESKNFMRKANEPLKLFIHISEREIANLIVENSIVKESDFSENTIFNIYDNAARALFKEIPLYSSQTFNAKDENNPRQFTMLIIGFNNFGEGIFRQAAKIAHFANIRNPRFIIAGCDIEKKERRFYQRYPEIKNCCDVIFAKYKDAEKGITEDYDLKSREFYEQIVTEELDYIAVCVDDDELSLNTWINIINHYKFNLNAGAGQMPVIVTKAIREPFFGKALYEIKKDKKNQKLLSQFASFDSMCSIDMVINETLDKMAKAVNDYYAKLYNGKAWKKISMFHKESSRANAEHINTKLYLLDLQAVEVKNAANQEKITKAQYEECLVQKMELLAKIEHQRWNAFHYLNGWRYAPVRDDNKKLHNCLTSWDSLTEKDKQKDRDTIINIPQILEEGGYQMVKLMTKDREATVTDNTRTHEKLISGLIAI